MRISVITATLNSAPYLEECIRKIVEQRSDKFEHIIVDGGSRDGTVQIARRYPHVFVVEKPGCSIYEAWNIGLDIATGEFIGICNSDDYYAPNTFARVIQEAASNPHAWMISGRAIQFTRQGSADICLTEYSDRSRNRLHFEDLNLFGPIINARFLSNKLIAKFGKFDTRFRLGSDCSYLMAVALAQLPVVTVDEVFYDYRSHSSSTTLGGNIKNASIALEEKLRIGSTSIRRPAVSGAPTSTARDGDPSHLDDCRMHAGATLERFRWFIQAPEVAQGFANAPFCWHGLLRSGAAEYVKRLQPRGRG